MTSPTKAAEAAKADHEAHLIVHAWIGMREKCEHYGGIKDDHESVQCSHNGQRTDWCGFTSCPRLNRYADAYGVR